MKKFEEVKELFGCDIISYYGKIMGFSVEANNSLTKSKQDDLIRVKGYKQLIDLVTDIIEGEWVHMGYVSSNPELFVEEYYRD